MDVHQSAVGSIKRPHPAAGAAAGTTTIRTRVLESAVGLVETLHCAGALHKKSPEDFSPRFQICLPYRGLFVWHVGGDDIVADPNQALFVSGGESYCISQRSAAYAELIITPDLQLLAEISNAYGPSLSSHPLFQRRSRRISLGFQQLRTRFLNSTTERDSDGLAAEESIVSLVRCALEMDTGGGRASRATRRLIGRTKEFLEGNLADPLRLADVARAVGVSPAYLTDVFRRVEGVPVHRYLTQLRLAQALVELPHANDLTALALGLGFSSHSHFTAVFRRAFDCTPSEFRRRPSTNHRHLTQ
jgi:AraC-like DNA-binding protein